MLRARFSKQLSKYRTVFGTASVCMCESLSTCRFSWIQLVLYPVLVNLEMMILDGWINSHYKSDVCIRTAFFQETAGGRFKFWIFLAPPVISSPVRMLFYLWICIVTENLCGFIWMLSELMSWASCEVVSPLQRGKLGKRRDLPEVTGDVWGALEGVQHFTWHHLPPGHLQESAAAIDPLLWA